MSDLFALGFGRQASGKWSGEIARRAHRMFLTLISSRQGWTRTSLGAGLVANPVRDRWLTPCKYGMGRSWQMLRRQARRRGRLASLGAPQPQFGAEGSIICAVAGPGEWQC
jgi:hypothetical protein